MQLANMSVMLAIPINKGLNTDWQSKHALWVQVSHAIKECNFNIFETRRHIADVSQVWYKNVCIPFLVQDPQAFLLLLSIPGSWFTQAGSLIQQNSSGIGTKKWGKKRSLNYLNKTQVLGLGRYSLLLPLQARQVDSMYKSLILLILIQRSIHCELNLTYKTFSFIKEPFCLRLFLCLQSGDFQALSWFCLQIRKIMNDGCFPQSAMGVFLFHREALSFILILMKTSVMPRSSQEGRYASGEALSCRRLVKGATQEAEKDLMDFHQVTLDLKAQRQKCRIRFHIVVCQLYTCIKLTCGVANTVII